MHLGLDSDWSTQDYDMEDMTAWMHEGRAELGDMLALDSTEDEDGEYIGRRARGKRKKRTRRRRRKPKKRRRKRKGKRWVGKMKLKKGAFTAQAKRRGMTAKQFMAKVLANPKQYSKTTVRRARLMKTFLGMKKK